MGNSRLKRPVVASESAGNTPTADWQTEALRLAAGKSGWFLTGKQAAGWLQQAGIDLTETTIRKILTEAGEDLRPGISIDRAPSIIIGYYKGMSEKTSRQKDEDIARRAKSEADLAELKLGQEIGEVVLISDVKQQLAAMVVAFREKIRLLSGLTMEQRKAVMDELVALKLEQPQP